MNVVYHDNKILNTLNKKFQSFIQNLSLLISHEHIQSNVNVHILGNAHQIMNG